MRISLTDAGKRFNREWIFRHTDLNFESGKKYAITGPNGSGKSTLLQVIGGILMPSEGKISYVAGPGPVETEQVFGHVAFCAPYLELIEEMTGEEFLRFHSGFKPFTPGSSVNTILAETGLEKAGRKQIRNYSSGMKQRLKLAQAIFSDTPVLLLDEPCTNLDKAGISTYRRLVEENTDGRLVVISSNDEAEFDFCDTVLDPDQWKKTGSSN
jgi:ABC-type multidrug transport system ATPase subunit